MAKRLVIERGPVPVVTPVAYLSKKSGHIFIPKPREEGGGFYNPEATFHAGSYHDVSDKVWSRACNYEPLYEGTVLKIVEEKEIKL